MLVPPTDESTLTLSEAARIARCHVDTLRHRCRDGSLPHFRGASGKIRIRAADFEEFLMSEQTPRAYNGRRAQA